MMAIYPAFVYDEKRKFSKLCILFKMMGFGYYLTTTMMCTNDKRLLWFGMVSGMMFMSICNMIRYEYAFYKVYGTIFQSIDAFKQWKIKQKPHIKHEMDFAEFLIKVVYLCRSLPPTFEIHDNDGKFSMCELGGSVIIAHILTIMSLWSLSLLFFSCIYVSSLLNSRPQQLLQPQRDAMILNAAVNAQNAQNSQNGVDAQNRQNGLDALEIVVIVDNETECCICLEKNENLWVTSECAHSFHVKCISEWMKRNPSCPVCRATLIQTV